MVKLGKGAADVTREGVYHARLRRLGTEGRWTNLQRAFVPLEISPTESAKHFLEVPC